MVPYMWRRHLGILRAMLAFLCLILYLIHPVPGGTAISFVVGGYGIYSVFTLIRDHIENRVYLVPMLILD